MKIYKSLEEAKEPEAGSRPYIRERWGASSRWYQICPGTVWILLHRIS